LTHAALELRASTSFLTNAESDFCELIIEDDELGLIESQKTHQRCFVLKQQLSRIKDLPPFLRKSEPETWASAMTTAWALPTFHAYVHRYVCAN
jgi:hypothetical protein